MLPNLEVLDGYDREGQEVISEQDEDEEEEVEGLGYGDEDEDGLYGDEEDYDDEYGDEDEDDYADEDEEEAVGKKRGAKGNTNGKDKRQK